jgi:hypothetical protein
MIPGRPDLHALDRAMVRMMVGWPRVVLTAEQAAEATDKGNARQAFTSRRQRVDFLKDRKGGNHSHVTGVIAETAYALLKGYPLSMVRADRLDRGNDFPDGTDVKGSRHSEPRLILNVSAYRRKRPAWRYVLARVTYGIETVVELCGWVPVERFERDKESVVLNPAYGPVWAMDYEHLNPMEHM